MVTQSALWRWPDFKSLQTQSEALSTTPIRHVVPSFSGVSLVIRVGSMQTASALGKMHILEPSQEIVSHLRLYLLTWKVSLQISLRLVGTMGSCMLQHPTDRFVTCEKEQPHLSKLQHLKWKRALGWAHNGRFVRLKAHKFTLSLSPTLSS